MDSKIFSGIVPEILVIDDNPLDLQLLGEAFAEVGIPAHLHHVANGYQALQYLEHRETYRHAPDPELLLLDLNMPRIDGRSLLELIDEHPRWKQVPVVVLSSSDRRDDIAFCSRHGAISYYVKPHTWDEYLKMVLSFKEFWVAQPKFLESGAR
jgi:CheY-like chemotaxis protein